MKNYKTIIAAVVAGLACSAATSKATLTNYGSQPTEVAPSSPLQSQTSPFSVSPFSGTFKSWVENTSAVALGLGFTGYTFVFQMNVDSGDTGEGMTLNGFGAGAHLGFAYLNSAPSADPSTVAQNSISGKIDVTWTQPGYTGTGDLLYIYTDSHSYGLTPDAVKDQQSANVIGLSPVPEPSTVVAGALMLLPFGIGAIRSLRKDRTA